MKKTNILRVWLGRSATILILVLAVSGCTKERPVAHRIDKEFIKKINDKHPNWAIDTSNMGTFKSW